MKTMTVEIDLSTVQAQQFVEYARTLPFAHVVEPALEETMTVEEFIGEAKRQAEEYFCTHA